MNFLEIFKKIRQWLTDLWGRTDKKDRTRFFMIAGVSAVVIVAAVLLLTKATYIKYFFEMDPSTTNEVSAALTSAGIPNRIGDGATSVSVPENQVDKAVVAVAEAKVALKTGKTYDIFALGGGLTSSEYEREKYEQYQREDNLARLLVGHIDAISNANVMLSLPEKKTFLFASEVTEPTASVWLTMKGGETATRDLVRTVQTLVANTVDGMKAENVAVTDQSGTLLSYDKEDNYSKITSQWEFEKQVARDLDTAVMSLLSSMFGPENVSVKSRAKLDYSEKQTKNTIFSPVVDDQGIPVSMQTISEEAWGNTGVIGEPGMDENGGGDTYTGVDSDTTTRYKKVSETVNYEVTKSEELINKNDYEIDQVTIAVIINSNKLSQDNSNIDTVRQLVGGAIGLEKADYGMISVSINPFDGVTADQKMRDDIEAARKRTEMFEFIKVIVLYVIIGVCVILIALRTLAMFRKKPSDAERTALEALGNVEAEIDEYGELVKLATVGEQIEIVKSPTRERVEEFIENNPDAVASLLRNWLAEEYNDRKKF